MIIDTHAHLTDDSLCGDLEHYLEQAKQADVTGVLTVGTKLACSREAVALAERYPEVRAAVGIHPNTCCQAAVTDWEEIVQLANHPRVAALGETGLDRYWDDCPWEQQVEYFRQHLELSRKTSLPVVIHMRECAEETLELMQEDARQHGRATGVMHSFTGSQQVAEGCLELGLYISFAGMVTFKSATDLLEIATRIPLDRILVETDSPYLTPHPFRGKRPNHPARVVHTLQHIAQARGLLPAEFADITTANAQRLFGDW